MKELREIKTNDLKTYYGSPLNQLIREEGRRDMTVINIDLAINYYRDNHYRLIESKRGNEKMGKGQEIFLQKLSRSGIEVYTIYGDYPYEVARIYSFQDNKTVEVNRDQLIQFLDNFIKFEHLNQK